MKTKLLSIGRFISLGAALALGLASVVPNARANDNEIKENRGQLTASDYKFVAEAAKGGLMEVDLGQLAVQKAADPAVRHFGERMVQDHRRLNQELTDLLARKGAILPDNSSGKEGRMTEHLNGLTGSEFDRAYIKDMVRDHKKDVKAFQKEAEKADDADLKSWVAKSLPIVQEHLQQAESIKETITGVKRTSRAD
jgi:putative membrane protein